MSGKEVSNEDGRALELERKNVHIPLGELGMKWYNDNEFYILDPVGRGNLNDLNKLVEIAQADYPMLNTNEVIVDGIIGTHEGFNSNVYAISFILDDVEPREDYKPLSELFPLGFEYFN